MRKRFINIICAAAASVILCGGTLSAQSLRVSEGGATYVHSSANTGEMLFDGTSLTIEGKVYRLTEGLSMEVTADGIADNTIDITYSGSSAKLLIAGNIARYLTVSVSGADVAVVSAAEMTEEVKYTLHGTSTDGSFMIDGSHPCTVTLDNLTLSNADGAPIDIENGKLINVVLNGSNTLTDGAGGELTACVYINGHSVFSGTGTLTVNGNVKHGITGDEYVTVNSGTIDINAAGDGLHVSQYFRQTGGSIKIQSVGEGIDVDFKGVNKGTKDEYADNGFVFLSGGKLDIVTTGNASKGIKADSTITVTGIEAVIRTIGSAEFDTAKNDISSCAAISSNGYFVMSSGTLNLSSTGAGGKGLNIAKDVDISGGNLYVTTIGERFTHGIDDSKAHGIKSDADINIKGGNVYVAASSYSGNAFKTDYFFTITGGTLMGIAAKASTPTSATQNYKKYSGVNVTASQTVSYDGVSYKVPANYSNTNAKIIVSSGSM